jgi:hypothetical protein
MAENTSYLLFIFSKNKIKQKELIPIFEEFTPIISSEFLKYNYDEHSVVAHFETIADFSDLRIFVENLIGDTFSTYFLLEKPKNISVSLPTDLKLNLFDLNTNADPQLDTTTIDFFNVRFLDFSKLLEEYENEEDYDFFDEDILLKPKRQISIDEVLDKIIETGINSLNQHEREILNNYSKP